MKNSIALPPGLIGRDDDLEYIRKRARAGECCSLVGISNLGKSAFLRHLCESSNDHACVYVDCNAMPERNARAFYVAVWRALADAIATRASNAQTRAREVFDALCAATNATDLTLAFDEGIALALKHLPHPLVLLLDDFDEAYKHLEAQTFLNLRAFKDRHGASLAYVAATERELARMTTTREQGEFLELCAPRVRFLHFWQADDTRRFCEYFAAREKVTFSADDLKFIHDHADGHPGLTQAICYALGAITGAPQRNAQQDRMIHQAVQKNLATDANAQSECEKIWDDLDADERDALLDLTRADDAAAHRLRAKFILREDGDDTIIFSRVFADFVRRQKLMRNPQARGIYIDADAGAVWMDGNAVEALTDLEYRLLLYLYGRIDRVCDKYSIVKNVWGEEFIDEVDDARVEKLISRVRAKIEPDATKPRYVISVRGRGYKLVR
ncbi:MAG: winged helix-turn-helix domain-containing protein [Chloroflexi bacterium]|nr:winged helix-turn-helix domain-containing protein [Chloroflexota bacterium]